MEKQWPPPSVVANIAKIEDLLIIFTEAKERLKESIDSTEKYYQRSLSIFLQSITLLTGSLAFISSRLSAFKLTVTNLIAISTVAILVLVLLKLKQNITTVTIKVTGTEPRKSFVDDFFTDLPKQWCAEKMLYYNLIRDYQSRIDDNAVTNNKRADRIDNCIKWLYVIPLIAVALIAGGAFFHWPFFI